MRRCSGCQGPASNRPRSGLGLDSDRVSFVHHLLPTAKSPRVDRFYRSQTTARAQAHRYDHEAGVSRKSRARDVRSVKTMKTVILDATELSRDWLCTGLKYQILEHTGHVQWLTVVVPPSVLEETAANYFRNVEKANQELARLNKDRVRLGLSIINVDHDDFDYRRYIRERFRVRLGITVPDWPTVPHADLVSRAVSRVPPFDEKGSGYRDSLVWAHAIEFASRGADVALVSADRIFAGSDNTLTPELAKEVEPLPGKVELVRDFGSWLLEQLPWSADSLESALAQSRYDEFFHYFEQSDLDLYLIPEVEDLEFRSSPYSCEIIDSEWTGYFAPVDSRTGPDGLTLVEFDISQLATFDGKFPENAVLEQGWIASKPDLLRRVHIRGTVHLIVRIAVLFGIESGFSVGTVSWRRAGPGWSTYLEHDPDQLSLFDQSQEDDTAAVTE